MTVPAEGGGLTPFQAEVAQLLFSLPGSARFLLAGGGALLAQGLTSRPTTDLDFFTRVGLDVPVARDELERAAEVKGWSTERIQDDQTFCRLRVHAGEDLLVDIALEAPPGMPATASFVGPTFAAEELAGRKLLALFDRAAARDFADVFVLVERFGKDTLIGQAEGLDAGFDLRHLAGQMTQLARFEDSEIPFPDPAGLRSFFAA